MKSLLDERDRSFLNEFGSCLVVTEEFVVTSALGMYSCLATADEGGGGGGGEVSDGGRQRGGGRG